PRASRSLFRFLRCSLSRVLVALQVSLREFPVELRSLVLSYAKVACDTFRVLQCRLVCDVCGNSPAIPKYLHKLAGLLGIHHESATLSQIVRWAVGECDEGETQDIPLQCQASLLVRSGYQEA